MTQPIDFSQPQRLPLIPALDSRSYDLYKDALLVNCIAERQQSTSGYKIRKRFGTGTPIYDPGFNIGGYGMHYWSTRLAIYTVVKSGANFNVYQNGVLLFTQAAPPSFYNWDFEESSGLVKYLVVGSRQNIAYTIRSDGVVAQIVDPDFLSIARVSGFVHLNGRIYVMDSFGYVRGSDIDNPNSWNALNVIQARSEPDLGIALAKHMSYIVAFKERTMEFFSDVGAPTGSSLALVPGLQKPFGCISPDSIRGVDGELFWISINRNKSPQVARMSNAQVQIVSTPGVERILGALSSSSPVPNNIAALTAVCFRSAGHSFYMINLAVTTNVRPASLVYDITEDLWYIWVKESVLPGYQIPMGYAFEASNSVNQYFQDPNTGAAVPFGSDDLYTSDGSLAIRAEITTPNYDAGTKRWKVLSRLSIGVDEQVGSQLYISYNDRDYDSGSWSNPRTVDLNHPEPFLQNEGRFRRRAYRFVHNQNSKMRLAFVDMQLSLGAI